MASEMPLMVVGEMSILLLLVVGAEIRTFDFLRM